MAPAGETMSLVFTRAALERLDDPTAVFADGKTWADVVGIVADDPPEQLSTYAAALELDPDFISSVGGQTGGLAVVRQQSPTDRHVVVGTAPEEGQLAASLGWEFLLVAEAAEAAGWALADDVSNGSCP